jgi:hypothetical protein
MTSSVTVQATPMIRSVEIADGRIVVFLADGRTISVPISWYPRLSHAHANDLSECRITGRGKGIHWPKLDEDISVENILFGQPSGESSASFQRWLEWYGTEK